MDRMERLRKAANALHIARVFKQEAEKDPITAKYNTAYQLNVSLQEVARAIGTNHERSNP